MDWFMDSQIQTGLSLNSDFGLGLDLGLSISFFAVG